MGKLNYTNESFERSRKFILFFVFSARPDVPIPEMYQFFDPNWTLGKPLSEDTLSLVFATGSKEVLRDQLVSYIQANDSTCARLQFANYSPKHCDAVNLMLNQRRVAPPPAENPDLAMGDAYRAFCRGTVGVKSADHYTRSIFTGDENVISFDC